MKEDLTLEENITTVENLLQIFREVDAKKKHCEDRMSELHMIELDIMHKMELEDLGYHEVAKLALKLQENQRKRRVYKDQLYYLDQLHAAKTNQNFTHFYNTLSNTVGELRKHRAHLEDRVYTPKSGVKL